MVLPGFIPSTIIGVMRPIVHLERLGEINIRLRLSKFPLFLSRDVKWCDIAVFCRNTEIEDLHILYELKCAGKKVVYEIDDNFEEIDLNTEIGVYHRSFQRIHVLRRFFGISDLTRIYSERLSNRASYCGAQIQRVRSYFDMSIIEGVTKRPKDGVIRIAYPTSRIDGGEIEELLFSAIRDVLNRYPQKVEFHLWTKTVPKQLSGQRGVVLNRGVGDYEKFIREFYKIGFDIGVAPGLNTPFFCSKTNNKYREFGGCGIAGIYSNLPPYSDSVLHESTGLLVGKNSMDWVAAIERLIFDNELRQKIKNNALADVSKNYSFKASVDSWRECFSRLHGMVATEIKWLAKKTQLPTFSFVSMNKIKVDDDRYQLFINAAKFIKNSIVHSYLNLDQYVSSSWRTRCCATIFLIDNRADLISALNVVELSASLALDLTLYKDDYEEAAQLILGKIHTTPLSLLIPSGLDTLSRALKEADDSLVVIKVDPSDASLQQFSTCGYPLAYLDLIERHIQYSPEYNIEFFHVKISIMINKILEFYDTLKRRLRSIIILIGWRLGIRVH